MNELAILDWFQTLHSPFGDIFWRIITTFGEAGWGMIVLSLILIIIPKTRKMGVMCAIALLLDVIICNAILKNAVARVRPYDVNTLVDTIVRAPKDFSFPSGHTAASFAVVGATMFAKEKKFWIPLLIFGVLMGISRLYFYIHYPTDVLGGLVVGLICGFLGGFITSIIWSKFFEGKSTKKITEE